MNTKKEYKSPTAEDCRFETKDVITASSGIVAPDMQNNFVNDGALD